MPPPEPFAVVAAWFEEARASGAPLPEAAALATATPDGAPSVRMVLVKELGAGGCVFFSNYGSRKGEELAANPRAALLLYWHELGRQVRVEGPVERIAREASAAYFATRPPGSRRSAWASRQSRPVGGRAELEAAVEEARRRFGDDVPLPEDWGGYRLRPERVELWRHRDDRLHERELYTRSGGGWTSTLLQP